MLRIISRLDIKNENLIKTVSLEGLRIIGNPADFAKKYYREGIDEILVMDVVASLYGRNNLYNIIKELSKEVFIPITLGGGIRTEEDAIRALSSGADKVAINSAAFKNPNIISRIANSIGSSSVVLSVEAKRVGSDWFAYFNSGRDNSGLKVIDWILQAISKGAGEVLITSIDYEGMFQGFDLEFLKLLQKEKNKIKVPIILSGGISSVDNVKNILEIFIPSAISIAGMFHYNKMNVIEFKKNLKKFNIKVR